MYRGEFFMIGHGDLIFFMVLLGRAALQSWLSVVLCTLAVAMVRQVVCCMLLRL